jgi:hypothetical protein
VHAIDVIVSSGVQTYDSEQDIRVLDIARSADHVIPVLRTRRKRGHREHFALTVREPVHEHPLFKQGG